MSKGKLSHLTDAQLHSLAKRHLSGHTSVDLEGFAGLDVDQIRYLLRTDRMRGIVAEEQQYLDGQAARIRNRMSYGIEDSVDRMKARGSGADGPQIAYNADKFLIESLLPRNERHVVETHNTHSFDAQLVVHFRDALDALKTITGTDTIKGNGSDISRYTLLGTEGIATAEPEEPVTELVTPGPLGSDSPPPADSQDQVVEVPSGKSEPPPSE